MDKAGIFRQEGISFAAFPVTKGQTASSSYKPAVLSNGIRTGVPPHVSTGTRIVVMTEDGSYVERAKD
ncbi:hypothetical protein ksw1_27130 [Staphylococcus aureus]|nr:hypothetical protein ksw1_27130 [Staphylococcus aureus]